jgi:AraC family transcriptional regulator, transcriptional activator of pobA
VLTVDLSRYEQYARHAVAEPHRDDHYTLLIVRSGRVELAVDFKSVNIVKPSFLLITPEQVHQLIRMNKPAGWLVNVETAALPNDLRMDVGNYLREPLFLPKGSLLTSHVFSLLHIAADVSSRATDVFMDNATQSVIHSVMSLALSLAKAKVPAVQTIGRAAALYRQFKALLELHFKSWKQTSDYAAAMAISASHLNDTIKAVSGLAVSVHIQERNVLEAKRLLYNTDLMAGEVGFALGYEDPVYFGKLFKKHTQLTPQGFRVKFRE